MITITHTHEDGTLIHGTSKGDGVYEIVRPFRFRYFPSIKMIGIAQSRDHLAKRWQIESAAEALRAAGHEVTVEIDDTPRDVTEVKADRIDRLDDRKDALTARAERNAAEAGQRMATASALAEARNGQPRLAGHYSCKAWDAAQKKIENNDRLNMVAYGKAKHYEQAAAVVGKAEDYRERPEVIIRRIATTEADLRRTERTIAGTQYAYGEKPSGDWLASLEARRTFLSHQLDADRKALSDREANGYRCHSRETIHVGDVVRCGRGGWGSGEVVRVSVKSVSVTTPYSWTDRVSYERITEVICKHETSAAIA